jgi:hypothetical protein
MENGLDFFYIGLIITLIACILFFFFHLLYNKGDKKAEANYLIDSLAKHDDMWQKTAIIDVVEKYCQIKYDFFCEFPPDYNAEMGFNNFDKCPLEILEERQNPLKSKPNIFEHNITVQCNLMSRLNLPCHFEVASVYVFNEPNKDDFCVVNVWYDAHDYSEENYSSKQRHYFLCRKQRNKWLIEEINYNRFMPIENYVKHPDLINLIGKRIKKQFIYNSFLLLAFSTVFAILLQNIFSMAIGLFIGILILVSRFVYIFTLKFFFKKEKDLYYWERIYNLP